MNSVLVILCNFCLVGVNKGKYVCCINIIMYIVIRYMGKIKRVLDNIYILMIIIWIVWG